jgi:hypothetical protein
MPLLFYPTSCPKTYFKLFACFLFDICVCVDVHKSDTTFSRYDHILRHFALEPAIHVYYLLFFFFFSKTQKLSANIEILN